MAPLLGRFTALPSPGVLKLVERHEAVLTDSTTPMLMKPLSTKPFFLHLRGDPWVEWASARMALARYRSSLARKATGTLVFWLRTLALPRADLFLPICRWLDGRLQRIYPGKRSQVLYQAVDPNEWYAFEEPYRKPTVAIVQDFHVYQKVRGFLQFRDVARELSNVRFLVAGSGAFIPMAREIMNLPNVHFLGRLRYPDGVRDLLSRSHVYALPSGLDCSPLTLLEAQLMRKPIVASNVGGIPENMRDGETGFLARNGDVSSWCDKIRSLLDDPESAAGMGERGRDFVATTFSVEKIAWRLAELLWAEIG